MTPACVIPRADHIHNLRFTILPVDVLTPLIARPSSGTTLTTIWHTYSRVQTVNDSEKILRNFDVDIRLYYPHTSAVCFIMLLSVGYKVESRTIKPSCGRFYRTVHILAIMNWTYCAVYSSWISNCIHRLLMEVITSSCPNYNIRCYNCVVESMDEF